MMCLSRKIFNLAVVLTTAFLLVFISCSLGGGGGSKNSSTDTFRVQNASNGIYYSIQAERLVSGKYCTVWGETGNSNAQIYSKELADVFDRQIYTEMIEAFNVNKSFKVGNKTFTNSMAFADALGDGDGKLCILMLDIRDGYNGDSNKSYIAGYFSPSDLLTGANSNRRDMIYIDTYPSFEDTAKESTYATLAHEMQHMMNFVTGIAVRGSTNDQGQVTALGEMDLWINEGLSSAAEYIHLGKHTEDRYKYFTEGIGLANRGNNFFVWGNHDREDPYAINDEYFTVYLFFQWLRLQGDGSNSIYKNIINSTYGDYRAVTSNAYTNATNANAWQTLIGDWHAANYINASGGRHGYTNDSVLKNVKFQLYPLSGTTVRLAPGEGVYSKADSSSVPSQEGNIRYAGLTDTGVTSGTVTGALLTYNANTNNKGSVESGKLTGTPPTSVGVVMSTVLGSGSGVFAGPFRVGMHDILRQKGYENDLSNMNLTLSLKEVEGE